MTSPGDASIGLRTHFYVASKDRYIIRKPVIFLRMLTRAPLGYSAERAPLEGGGADSAPLPNSRTNRRSEAGEAAIESPEREDSNAH